MAGTPKGVRYSRQESRSGPHFRFPPSRRQKRAGGEPTSLFPRAFQQTLSFPDAYRHRFPVPEKTKGLASGDLDRFRRSFRLQLSVASILLAELESLATAQRSNQMYPLVLISASARNPTCAPAERKWWARRFRA